MSIDYNEKFKELRKKIANISEMNSEFSIKNNFYKNRLKQLELNSEQRIENISKKLTHLKNDFIKINSIFLNDVNNKAFNKNSSFYYPLMQKKENDEKKIFLKNFSNQISEEILNNSKEIQNNLYLKLFEMENRLKKIIEKKREDKKLLKKEIIMLAGDVRENFENLNQKVDTNKLKEESILSSISENFKKEIYNTNIEIKEMQKSNEKNEMVYANKIKEMNDWIANNFRKEKRKREMFQENVMNILKETCQKLSDDFYRNNNSNNNEYEEDENDVNEEEENIRIYNNNMNQFNNLGINENNNINKEFSYNNNKNNNLINIEVNQNPNQEKEEEENNIINEENNIINNVDNNDEENNEMIDEQNYEEYNEEMENYEEGNYEEYEKYANEDINNENELNNMESNEEEENVEEINENNNEEINEENEIKE
jgi:hypothetical protein